MEALAERGPLTVEQEAELAELQPKVAQLKQKKEESAKYQQAGKAAADRVVVLEALAERGPLTVEQKAELAEVRRRWRSGSRNGRRERGEHYKEKRLLIGLWCWRSWRSGGR
ncbi:hypothetical protein [Saccharopolyspora spinosa]|uniref:hypothetical protein n=1 Tax=Saccharopolyspora spinosa TaxID=60894 RepID=UPI00376EA39B